MGAIDRLAKIRRRKPKEPQLEYTRTEKDGWIIYQNGDSTLKVNPIGDYREALIKLLEEVGGYKEDPKVIAFWNRQAEKMLDTKNEMQCRQLQDIYERLTEAWDELTKQPPMNFFEGLE